MANMMKTTLFLALLTGLFVAVGGLLGGQNGMVMAFGLALVMNFVSYWFSDKIVLKMYGAKPLAEGEAPAVHRIVRNLATKAGIPMPKLYLLPSAAPNAFATGPKPAARRGRGDGRHHADHGREGAGGGPGPRALARAQPGRPDLDGRRDHRGRDLACWPTWPSGA